jgi:hypothetical protein
VQDAYSQVVNQQVEYAAPGGFAEQQEHGAHAAAQPQQPGPYLAVGVAGGKVGVQRLDGAGAGAAAEELQQYCVVLAAELLGHYADPPPAVHGRVVVLAAVDDSPGPKRMRTHHRSMHGHPRILCYGGRLLDMNHT